MGSRNAGSFFVGINTSFVPDLGHHSLHFDVIMVTNSGKSKKKANGQPKCMLHYHKYQYPVLATMLVS
jgi:hypothetical protein